LHNLNQEQLDAVQTTEGALLVLAGAGSGKTRVVTHRIVHLLENGVSPAQILGVTFTNKAAQEMKERILKMTRSHVLISTFHSLGARILRESISYLGYRPDFTIYDEDDVEKVLKGILREIPQYDKKLEVKPFRSMISNAKNSMLSPSQIKPSRESEEGELFPMVYDRYEKALFSYNALDFDDLLYLTVRLFKEHPHVLEMYQSRWRYLLIDEYQDTNEAQYRMVQALSLKSGNVCAVGDPDQSIYSWRGANIDNILNFEKDFPGAKVVRLEQNYRSRTNILDAANAVIQNNQGRLKKNLWSSLGPGEKIHLFSAETEQDEARFVLDRIQYHHMNDGIPLSQMAVLYRTNAQSRAMEDRFLFSRLPYVIVGGISFYQRKEIKDILGYLRMVQSNSDYVSFLRTLNLPKRGIGEATIEKIRLCQEELGIPIFDYCLMLVKGESTHLKLTARQLKGLEDYVGTILTLRKISKLSDLVTQAIEKTGYLDYLKLDPETYLDRKDNLDELIGKAIEWEEEQKEPTLDAFLEELTLKSSLDEADQSQDRIVLMTVHNGKGLEFPVVFVVGMEEDLFPHVNSRGNNTAQEEERRLFYVAMTRAKERLYLTHTKMRYLWGTSRFQRPSRFLQEIPGKYTEELRAVALRKF
jgi:DNA helicase-2/ATP-dependent DNA helicase PcrA